MKYLLSILVLFSGLSFADDTKNGKGSLRYLQSLNTETETYNTYLTCDTSYLFYPSIEDRFLFAFNGTSNKKVPWDNYSKKTGSIFYYSLGLVVEEVDMTVVFYSTDLLFTINYTTDLTESYRLNRTTLKLDNDMQCTKVSKKEYIDAKSNILKYAEEQRAKRKI